MLLLLKGGEDVGEDSDSSGNLSDDSVDNMLKNSKIKLDLNKKSADLKNKKQPKKKASEEVFGIPDGSDSEISDFDVDENGAGDDEDDEDEDDEFDEDEEDLFGEKAGEDGDDIDSDEVDEDLVDLYTDLGEFSWNPY